MTITISFVKNKHHAPWSPIPVVPYLAYMNDIIIGSYHAAGMWFGGYVVGQEPDRYYAETFDHWVARVKGIEGRYGYWIQEKKKGFTVVRFPTWDMNDWIAATQVCEGSWSEGFKGYVIPESHYEFLAFLTKIEFPPNPWDA